MRIWSRARELEPRSTTLEIAACYPDLEPGTRVRVTLDCRSRSLRSQLAILIRSWWLLLACITLQASIVALKTGSFIYLLYKHDACPWLNPQALEITTWTCLAEKLIIIICVIAKHLITNCFRTLSRRPACFCRVRKMSTDKSSVVNLGASAALNPKRL